MSVTKSPKEECVKNFCPLQALNILTEIQRLSDEATIDLTTVERNPARALIKTLLMISANLSRSVDLSDLKDHQGRTLLHYAVQEQGIITN